MIILWDEWTEKYKWELVGALTAITLIGVGVFLWKSRTKAPEGITVLSATVESQKIATASAGVYVDVAGAVNQPGLYQLASNSRVEDVLIMAGGLSEAADSKWIEINLNRAEKVRDGMKLYIPAKDVIRGQITQVADNKININAATSAQLEELKGIGPATAAKIINSRPYSSIDQLLEKKIVSKTVFNNIKDRIQAW